VVRDPNVRAKAIANAVAEVASSGFAILGTCDCSIKGPKGNHEAFVWARRSS
jgi:predicted rRNA methylase YqxC with S4 and FtsJ domains